RSATDCGACSAFGVDTTAASTSGSAASASQSVVTLAMPWRPANARAVSSWWFATATISWPFSRTARAWKSWIQPHPNSATLIDRSSGRGSRPGSLALHAGERDPFDEGLLGDEEQDDHRQHEQDGGGHLQVPQHAAMRPRELLQPDAQRPDLRVVDRVEERQEEVVPAVEELEQGHGDDRGLRGLHHHVPHDLQLVGPVHARG